MNIKLQKIKWTFIYLLSFAFVSVTVLVFVQARMDVMVLGFLLLLSFSGPLGYLFLLPPGLTFETISFVIAAVVSLLLWCYVFANNKSPAADLWLPVFLWVVAGTVGSYFLLMGAG